MSSQQLMLVAGEVSGDIHAGNLLRELRSLKPGVSAFGVGGDNLEASGLQCIAHVEELAHMGLFEVVRELPRIRKIMKRLVEEARSRRPDLAVLVDSPDFNLRLAAKLKKLGIPVILYVSPQLWAWRRGRVRVVRRVAREVLCILPFEVSFYERSAVPARFVGHPLVDDFARQGLLGETVTPAPRRVALLPGSRVMEIRQLLPVMVQALRALPDGIVSEALLVEAPGVGPAVDEVLEQAGSDPRLRRVSGADRRRELANSALAWTASGTATLECALLDVPMIVGYRLQAVSYAIAKLLVRVPHVSLVNLIAGSRIAPELLQNEFQPTNLAEVTSGLMSAGQGSQQSGLADVRRRLGGPGASRRAAEALLEYLEAS